MGRFTEFPRPRQQYGKKRLLGGLSCLVPALLGVLAVAFNLLPHNPLEFAGEPNAGPGGGFLLGCDALGRDMASRLGAAAAYFIVPGTLATFVALALGVVLGVAESLGGKLWGAVSGWCLEVLDSLPKFVIVLLVASIARSSLVWIMIAVGLTFAPQIAGAIRQSVSRLKDAAFIEAEKSLGVSMTRIVFVHILWGHARYVILAQLMSLMAYAMLVESSLSYLGGELGVQEPTPSWGNMLSLARDGLFSGHLMQAALPAVMISLTILGFTLVGRGMVFLMERRS